jgi:hypothetical protein
MDADAVLSRLRLALVGPEGGADRLLRGALSSKFLSCEPQPAFQYLRVLVVVHPLFRNVDVAALDVPATHEAVRNIRQRLEAGALRATAEADQRIEEAVRTDVAEVRWQTTPETVVLSGGGQPSETVEMVMDGLLLTRQGGVRMAAAMREGGPPPPAGGSGPAGPAGAEAPVGPTDEETAGVDRQDEELLVRGLVEAFTGGDQGQQRGPSGPAADDADGASMYPTAELRRAGTPLNEFAQAGSVCYAAFPDLFPLGRGLPDGAISPADDEHILRQDSLVFAQCEDYIFYRFNTVSTL